MSDRSDHISYDTDDHLQRTSIRRALMSLVKVAREGAGAPREGFRILDAGCGLGLLLRDLKSEGFTDLVGADIDEVCISSSSRFASCIRADVSRLDAHFEADTFDLVILSHVLEHMEHPSDVVRAALQISKGPVLLAVPNPIRPHIVLKHALRSRDYSNKGHYHSWDRSHFTNFLKRQLDLDIVAWAQDDVRAVPFRQPRALLRAVKLLEIMEERWLPRLFPYFATSLVVLCRPK